MLKIVIYTVFIALLWSALAEAHTINYQVENRGISARVFYGEDEPSSYSSYEIFGPGDRVPHQKGRTDKNGFVSFLPDRKGKWVIKVYDETQHGIHGAVIDVNVTQNLFMDSFKKPLVARFTKGFVGGSIILALFGVWALMRARKKYSEQKQKC